MKNSLPIEEQVCSLKQAKKLAGVFRKAGIEQPPSVWFWGKLKEKNEWEVFLTKARTHPVYSKHFTWMEKYNAYTGDELGVLLPACIGDGINNFYTNKTESDPGFHSGYDDENDSDCYRVERSANTEAQAKADLAIQGLKEGWIKPEDFNYAV